MKRICPICGEDMTGRRADAFVCGAPCRAELSRVRRLLAGGTVDGHGSLTEHLSKSPQAHENRKAAAAHARSVKAARKAGRLTLQDAR